MLRSPSHRAPPNLRVSILFCFLIAAVSAASNGNTEANQSPNKTLIVLAATFSGGLVVAGLWCYCMSAVCNVRQCDQTRAGRLTAVRGSTYIREGRGYHDRSPGGSLSRSESPTSSTTSSLDRSSPVP